MLDTTKLDLNNIEGTEAVAQKAWMRIDMKTQKEISTGGYATAVSPVDGTVWVPVPQVNGPQNKLYMLNPKTKQFKDYPLPPPLRLSHGIDFSTDGAIWFSAGSGHLGKLDPKTEKFSYWELPGPKFAGTGKETGSTEYPYFLWVDQFDTLGLGKDTIYRHRNNFGLVVDVRSEDGKVHGLSPAVSNAVLYAWRGRPHR